MKKKNNPFKMLGSWIGAFILYMSNVYYLTTLKVYTIPYSWKESFMVSFGFDRYGLFNIKSLIFTIFLIIAGFLLGWLIQNIMKKLKVLK